MQHVHQRCIFVLKHKQQEDEYGHWDRSLKDAESFAAMESQNNSGGRKKQQYFDHNNRMQMTELCVA